MTQHHQQLVYDTRLASAMLLLGFGAGVVAGIALYAEVCPL